MAFSTIVFAIFLAGVAAFTLILAYCSTSDGRTAQLEDQK